MQGTQYAPRESILCMEHFVALQGLLTAKTHVRCFELAMTWSLGYRG